MTTAIKGKNNQGKSAGDKYFSLIEHAADGIAIIQDGVFKLVNTALTHISGYDKKELLGMPFTHLLTPKSQKLTTERYQARLAGKKVRPVYEIKALTKDGEIRDIEVNATLTEYEGRVADEIIIRDITNRKQVEAALKESQEFVSTLLEKAPNAVVAINLDTSIKYVNPAWEELNGWTSEEVIGLKAPHPWWTEEQKEPMVGAFKEAIAQGSGQSEMPARKKNGELYWIAVRWATIKNRDGEPMYVLVNSTDITERKRMEEAITRAEREKTAILNSMSELVDYQDTEHRIIWTNTTAAESVGMTHEQLVGRHCYEMWPQRSQPCAGCPIAKARRTGKPQETEITTPDGRVWSIKGYPTRDENGAVIGLLEVTLDITERKQAEEKLQTILKTALDGFWLTNLEGEILEVNDSYCKMVGYTREELLKMSISDLEATESPEEVAQHIKGIIEQGYGRFESHHKRKDGKIIDVEISVNYLDVGQGQLFVFARDITERKQAEEAMRESDKFSSSLLANSPTPISVINPDTSLRYVNPALEKLTGFSTAELTGRKAPYPYWTEETAKKTSLGFKKAMHHGVGKAEELFQKKNGEQFWVEITCTRVISDGEFKYLLASWVDITERKQAEQALADEATRRRILVDQSLDGIVVLDENAKVYEANQKFAEMLGYTPEEVRELHTWDWDTQWTRKQLLEMVRSVDEAGDHFETYHRRKDGSTINVEISTNGTICADQKLVFCVCRDITERKKAEQLQNSENYVLTLLGQGAGLSELLDAIVRLGEYHDPSIKGSVLLFDSSKELLFLASAPSLPRDYQEVFENGLPLGPKVGSCGTAAYLKERVIVTDIVNSPLFKPFEEAVKRAVNGSLLAVWSQPIIASNGDLLGTIANYRNKVGEPSADNIRVLEWSARITAIAIERKQAEDALRESEERYRAVIEGAHDMIQSAALDGSINFVNQAWLDALGYTREDLPKLNLLDIISPDSCPHCQEMFAKVIKGEPDHNVQATFLTKDGRKILVEGNAAPRYIGDKVVATQGIFRDITARKQMEKQLQGKNEQLDAQNEELRSINEELQATEEELQHSQERLERMFESVTDGIVVASLDGTILKVNQSAVQMHGFATDDELLGKSAIELIAPRDRERISDEMLMVQEKGAIRDQECNLFRTDGTEFPGELSTSALKDASGKVIGRITIGRDITGRKQMEELFKMVTNSSPVGIYILQDSKFRLTNPQFQKLTGYSEEELAKIDPTTLVLPEDRDMVKKKAISMLKGSLSSPYQFRVTNKTGETRWVIETVTSIQYRGRRATLGNYIDITERKKAEEREDQLQQELNLAGRLASIGQLAAGVAHEINNPLTGVIGFSHLMLSRDIPDDMKQDLQVIHSEAQRVAKIVENLLAFAHQRKTGREYVDINDIITRVLELRAYEMKVNNIEVETQLNPHLPTTVADAGQLQQVFLNIILNAEYFMAKAKNKGKLLVKTEKIDGKIRASFSDDGAGISRENLDKIFNPFFTTKEVGKGTGLGLSICHGIITQHQGRIYAESELGKGAAFVIELPIVSEPAQAGKAKATQKETQKPRGAKILVVDDEAAILTFLHRLLTDMGHSVETINNADAALERLKTERYSLILLDIKLPGMSGIELYHHIEEIAPALTRRVMFITGDVMEGATRSFLEKAEVPHITKPIDIEELKKMMNNALNQTQGALKASG